MKRALAKHPEFEGVGRGEPDPKLEPVGADERTCPSITEAEERRYAELQVQALDLARAGETELLESMVRAGLPVNLADHKGNTLLMLACYHDHAGDRTDAPGARRRRRTAATSAARRRSAARPSRAIRTIARLLLEHGAAVDADNGNGMTPLMFAEMFGRTDVADVLRKRARTRGTRNRYGLTSGVLARTAFIWRGLMRLVKR